MPDAPVRARLSAAERNLRSRIAQIASTHWFLRGNLSDRASKCGKPSCHCAQGELHQSLYLVQSHQGKLRQVCIPRAWQQRIRLDLNHYQELQRCIEEVSELEWNRLVERKF